MLTARRHSRFTILLRALRIYTVTQNNLLRALERKTYKLAVLVYECIHAYLADALQPVTGLPGRERLCSSSTSALQAVPLIGSLRSATERSPSPLARTWNSDVIRSDVIKLSAIIQD